MKHGVVIVGGGPVGLSAAMRLARRGIACTVLEAATAVPRELRASTFHPPTLDMLAEDGITPRLLQAGLLAPTWQVRWHTTDATQADFAAFDLSCLQGDTDHAYRLQCEQWKLAEFLLEHLRECGVPVHAGLRVTALQQHDDHVTVTASDASNEQHDFTADYVIAADGARSTVRALLDIGFDGHTFPETTVLATTTFPFHEHIARLSQINYCWYEHGTFSLLRLPNLWRVSLYADEGESDEAAAQPAAVQAKLQRIHPRDEPYDVLEVRPYRIHQRVVQRYVHGRVVLAGDAAHVNSPSGGMGMNGGIHDAFNLADKLARIAAGADAGALLAHYERQRRPVALKHVLAQSGANRARMQERDPARRRAALAELQRKAGDPVLARQHLLETSMIAGLREAAAVS